MELMFLHGWGIRNTIWQGFTDQFNSFSVTSTPCLYEAANETNDLSLKAIAEVLNGRICADTIIIVWSISGLMAIPLAELSSKIKGIVFIASTPCFVNKENWTHVLNKENIHNLQNKLLANAENSLNYFSGLIAHGDLRPKETNKKIRDNIASVDDETILSNWLMQMINTDYRNDISKIDCPLQFILGENDSLINSNIETELKQLNLNIETNIIKECGHAPFISKGRETAKIINKFVNKLSNA